MKSDKKSLWILDGYSILFQSFYAIKEELSFNDIPLNAIYGSLNTILGIINKFKPDYILIALDTGYETFRDKICLDFQIKNNFINFFRMYDLERKINENLRNRISNQSIEVQELCNLLNINYNILEKKIIYEVLAIYLNLEISLEEIEVKSSYKANRKSIPEAIIPQFSIFEELIDALNIKKLSLKNYEADDIIASTAEKHKKNEDLEIFIASRDKDLMQLITDNVYIYNLKYKRFFREKDFLEKFEFKPSAFLDFLALTGDKSDNIPGVAGIGEKTAMNLLKKYNTVDNYLSQEELLLKELKQKDIIKNNLDMFEFSKSLIKLEKNLDIFNNVEDLRFNLNKEGLKTFSEKYNFKDKNIFSTSIKKKEDSEAENKKGFLF